MQRRLAAMSAAALVLTACGQQAAARIDDPLSAGSPQPAAAPQPDVEEAPSPAPPPSPKPPRSLQPSPEPTASPPQPAEPSPADAGQQDEQQTGADGDLVELPSFDSGGMAPAIAMNITLRADPESQCMWIEFHDDNGEVHTYAARFDVRYRARFTADPPQLLQPDDDGEYVVVAVAGETFIGAAQLRAEQLDRCHVGEDGAVAYVY